MPGKSLNDMMATCASKPRPDVLEAAAGQTVRWKAE
jgi:hypothetical protein